MIWLFTLPGCNSPTSSSSQKTNLPADNGGSPIESPVEASPDYFAIASQAVSRNDLEGAEGALRKLLVLDPGNVRAMEFSGDISAQGRDFHAADSMYRSALEVDPNPRRDLFDKRYKNLIRAGRPYDAIDVLLNLIQRFPEDVQSRYDITGISAAVGVPQLAIEPLRWLAQHGKTDHESLMLMASPQRVEPDPETCQKFLELAEGDRRAEFGLARIDAIKQNWDSVAKRLEPVISLHPEFVPAYALYGLAISELGLHDKLPDWQAHAPEDVESSAEYWIVVGRFSQAQGNHEYAARAFWESIKLDSVSHPEVLSRLFLSLHQLGRKSEANQVADQISKHSDMLDALKTHLEREGKSQAACMRVADTMLNLGRIWESEAWARHAVSLPSDKLPDLREHYMAIRNQLTSETPWQLPSKNIVALINLNDLSNSIVPVVATQPPKRESIAKTELVFEDQAREIGWNHTSIPQPEKDGFWIHQSVGGGVAVIDFDCDGWPDLAAATLDGHALQTDSSPNRLSRNLAGSFVDVSTIANYVDTGFGQGIAVGDYNEDGFPDLLDANIGRNRLFRNNGDGTFSDVSDSCGLNGNVWTTSLAMADIDGDFIVDIYEVAYCAGLAPYERECRNKYGLGTCTPLTFDAQPDRVWRGEGDGTFRDVTSDWMNQTSPGRGLGIVVGMLDEQPGIDVLVANDMTVNHLWSGQVVDSQFRLVDSGLSRGLGTSGDSRSQASMGIAADDADSDGDIDFLMTHFADDHNTFYEQVASGFWADRSHQVGLSEPSIKLLGFGTQWADFDNQGDLELIITNGHVDRVDREDVSYRMRPQLFYRQPTGRWVEWDRTSLGEYFSNDYLGRSLAVLDVNRDGKTDVAITHLADPAALLVNRTQRVGRAIGLELKATKTSRDAIGATVTAKVASHAVFSQLTAGNGYMASNQRRIAIGCGNAEFAEVTVHWPSGTVQEFGLLESGKDYVLIEGSTEAHSTWHHP